MPNLVKILMFLLFVLNVLLCDLLDIYEFFVLNDLCMRRLVLFNTRLYHFLLIFDQLDGSHILNIRRRLRNPNNSWKLNCKCEDFRLKPVNLLILNPFLLTRCSDLMLTNASPLLLPEIHLLLPNPTNENPLISTSFHEHYSLHIIDYITILCLFRSVSMRLYYPALHGHHDSPKILTRATLSEAFLSLEPPSEWETSQKLNIIYEFTQLSIRLEQCSRSSLITKYLLPTFDQFPYFSMEKFRSLIDIPIFLVINFNCLSNTHDLQYYSGPVTPSKSHFFAVISVSFCKVEWVYPSQITYMIGFSLIRNENAQISLEFNMNLEEFFDYVGSQWSSSIIIWLFGVATYFNYPSMLDNYE